MSYALCLLASFLQPGYILLCFLFLFLCPYVPHVLLFHHSYFLLHQLGLCSYFINWGSAVPFYPGYFLIEPWDSLSDYVHPGIACLAFWASDWAGAFWGSLSGFVISHLLLGVHPSVTLVKLIVIGYCCNCLDGQLNYLGSTHWLVIISEELILYWWLCHSTLCRVFVFSDDCLVEATRV